MWRSSEVTFAYGKREPAVKDVSFEALPGQHVAIVGPTGAGKTTLVSLLMRFYDPQQGRLFLDGVDIRKLTLSSLRGQISVVLQEPQLFSGRILENIRYGRLEASDDEVMEAAQAANAHDFITRLPKGYETEIGEGGAQLSGGERQRICVARAFLKDAPILVLDEPTSSIDSKTESVILDALDRLAEGRTTFIVAHRLSTIRHADLILVIDHGNLVERGTHEELLEHEGLYRLLYDAQIGQRKRPRAVLEAVGAEDDERVEETRTVLPAAGGWSMAAWSLVGAVSAALREGSVEPLRLLAAGRDDPNADMRAAAELAGALLADLDKLHAARSEFQLAGEGQPQPGIPSELLKATRGHASLLPCQRQPMRSLLRANRSGAGRDGVNPGGGKIVVLGVITRMPVAGAIWWTLNYLVGLRRLGFDVYYVEAHGDTPDLFIEQGDDKGTEKGRRVPRRCHETLRPWRPLGVSRGARRPQLLRAGRREARAPLP